MEPMQKYIKALKEGKGFDWIANYGYTLSIYELVDIIKELHWAIDDKLYECESKEVYKVAIEELENLYCEEE